jgi:hypothetical protein
MVILLYNNGLVIHDDIEYSAIGYQLLHSDGLHIFLENSEYNTAIYLEIDLTMINNVVCTSTDQIIESLGNPPVMPD